MSVKYKTVLKEFCDSARVAQPEYTPIRVGGEAHDPVWKVRVKLHDGRTFESGPVRAKKVGEEDAARAALQALGHQEEVPAVAVVAAVAAPAAARTLLGADELLAERVRVLVDADNVAFCDAAFCARWPAARFEQYVSFERNVPLLDEAAARCANAALVRAELPFKEASDLMIVIAATRLHDRIAAAAAARAPLESLRHVIIVSKDHMVLKTPQLFPGDTLRIAANDDELAAALQALTVKNIIK